MREENKIQKRAILEGVKFRFQASRQTIINLIKICFFFRTEILR